MPQIGEGRPGLNVTVSSATLLQGAWYALEQSGRLLTSAVLLHDHGDKSTALVLAMFSREELGRSKILRKIAKRVVEGEQLSPEDVRSVCENHLGKQAASALSITLTTQPPSRLDIALRESMSAGPGSEEWQRASKTPHLAIGAIRKRLPQERHEMRERALYVDLGESGTAWLRPSTVDSARCLDEIYGAANDYAGEYDKLRDDVIDADFPEMAAARAGMNPNLTLPEPRWPKFPQGGIG